MNAGLHSALADDLEQLQKQPLQKRFNDFIELSKYLCHYIEINMAHHLANRTPLILEGVHLLPRMATKKVIMFQPLSSKILKSVMLIESDDKVIFETMLQRGFERGRIDSFHNLPQSEQDNVVNMALMSRDYLAQEAQKHSVPIVEVRPYESLYQRVQEVISR